MIGTTAFERARQLQNLVAPMQDDVLLALDLLLPEDDGPHPVVLIRTPYNKRRWSGTPSSIVETLLQAGYAIAVQDVRGRNNSAGEWQMYFSERGDGRDTLAWIAAQPWCNGAIGMYGGSYEATVQWFAALSGDPHLRALVSIASTPNSLWRSEPIRGGAFLAPIVQYAVDMGLHTSQVSTVRDPWWRADRDSSWALPFSEVSRAQGSTIPWLDEMLGHPALDAYWERGELGDWSQFDVPAFHITGWWDMLLPGALVNYVGMREHAASASSREAQHLLIGPWAHHPNVSQQLNGVDLGDRWQLDLDERIRGFFDRHLKGESAAPQLPAAEVFVVGANEWWESEHWPLAGAQPIPFHLTSGGGANTLHGDGELTIEPAGVARSDAYDYDPADPVWAPFDVVDDGPIDDRVPSERADVLCYTGSLLERPLDVVGDVEVRFWASSSARDTDWHVRLVDVHPDGSARYLTHGVLRARFRDGYRAPRLLTPGEIVEYTIGMDAVAIRFNSGHRIRLELTSSWSPRYDRNLNTGAENPFTDAEVVVAHQRVHHGPEHPSRLMLPVVREGR